MIAFSPKALAAAAIAMSLSAPALACVEFTGNIDAQSSSGNIKAVDNDVQTCSGDIGSGDNNIDCISGFALNYDLTDNESGPQSNPRSMPVTYCNPTGCYQFDIEFSCEGTYASDCPVDFRKFC